MRFWDSSALIPLVLEEPGSERVRPLAAANPAIVFWWNSPVECHGAVIRAGRIGRLTDQGVHAAQRVLDTLWSNSVEIGPSPALREQAMRLVAVHPLRSADALQLAAALAWNQGRPAGAGFVCLDNRLRAAALRESFDVSPWPEEVHEP